MKTIFVAMNSSYVHTNPAVRSLSAVLGGSVSYKEYNINQNFHDVLRDILFQNADVIGFSCYIWNIEHVLRIAEDIKLAAPEKIIILGGPEATFRAEELLMMSFIDYVMCGEGEERIEELLVQIEQDHEIETAGVLYLKDGRITGNGDYQKADIGTLPLPFTGGELYDENKIYYYESSRGCPFSCAYCLSGIVGGSVREKSVEQVKNEIEIFVERGVKLVKFTDRTFNANVKRAKEIVSFVISETGNTSFHFEVALDLMDREFIELLATAPKGKIQLEAGVQTTNEKTLEAVVRKTDTAKIFENAKTIMKTGNIHLHLDLIAGLPHENRISFRKSFNEVYELYPDALQLGFLKLLPGTTLRENAWKYGIVFRSYAPYEVVRTNDISAKGLLHLKSIEELLNRYYNSGRARTAFDYLTKSKIFSPFELYERLYGFCVQNGYDSRPIGARNQFVLLIEFAEENITSIQCKEFFAALRLDYDRTKIKGKIPEEIS